jgi:hypothetical protein
MTSSVESAEWVPTLISRYRLGGGACPRRRKGLASIERFSNIHFKTSGAFRNLVHDAIRNFCSHISPVGLQHRFSSIYARWIAAEGCV